jgi:ribosomal protein S18 acetylase RimI-like enzyme
MSDERFARYEPQPPDEERLALSKSLQVRRALPEDRDALAALVFEREGGVYDEHRRGAKQELSAERSDSLLLIAQVQGSLVGFGRVRYMAPVAADVGAALMPVGWYLAGLIVSPAYRRRGIGAELTRQRLAWIAQRAGEAFYFANAANRASGALHERFGFVEITREFSVPGVSFTGGEGVLYRVELSQSAK